MVVLAVGDRRWLRAAYEEAYATFSPYVSEPGRPLGHLFLDKLFQVRIELPQLSQQRVDRYLASLLSVADHDAERTRRATRWWPRWATWRNGRRRRVTPSTTR